MDLLTVVIPALNLWEITRSCLESLAASLRGGAIRIVVVDNGSGDATATECAPFGESLFGERFTHLRLPENWGFGRACNAGAELAASRFVLFLNNDTTCSGNWLAPLLRAFEAEAGVGAVSPLLVFPEGTGKYEAGRVQHAGVCLDPSLHPTHVWSLFPPRHGAIRRRRSLQALSAAALLCPAQVFRDLGGFFPGFENGGEDMDLSCRMRRAGLKLRLVPESVVQHHTSLTPGRFDHARENARLLAERCRACFSPDLFRFWRGEGYEPRLTDWLEPYAVLPGNDAEPDPAREPLALEAYAPALAAARTASDSGEAARLAGLAAALFPSPARFAAAHEAALAAGRANEAARWRLRAAQADALLGKPEVLARRAEEAAAWARQAGEAATERLYADWLATRKK